MKNTKKIFAVMLCLLLMLTPLVPVADAVTVHAATETVKVKKDKETGEYYGYNAANEKVVSQWGVTAGGYRYYFGKDGAAYQADKSMGGSHCIVIKTIDKKKYAFDVSGRMVTGARVGSTSLYGRQQLFYFNPKTGIYDAAKTAKFRKAATQSTAKKPNSAATIKKLLGKAKKVKVSKNSCFLDGNGKDVQYIYDHLVLSVFRPNGSKKELVESVTLRF